MNKTSNGTLLARLLTVCAGHSPFKLPSFTAGQNKYDPAPISAEKRQEITNHNAAIALARKTKLAAKQALFDAGKEHAHKNGESFKAVRKQLKKLHQANPGMVSDAYAAASSGASTAYYMPEESLQLNRPLPADTSKTWTIPPEPDFGSPAQRLYDMIGGYSQALLLCSYNHEDILTSLMDGTLDRMGERSLEGKRELYRELKYFFRKDGKYSDQLREAIAAAGGWVDGSHVENEETGECTWKVIPLEEACQMYVGGAA